MSNYEQDSGYATLSFGTTPSQHVSVVVGGTPIMPDAGIDVRLCRVRGQTTDEHLVAPITLRVGEVITGRGFTIYGEVNAPTSQRTYGPRGSPGAPRLTGSFGVAWSWRKPNLT